MCTFTNTLQQQATTNPCYQINPPLLRIQLRNQRHTSSNPMTRFVSFRKRQIQRHNKICRMTRSRQLSSSCRSFINWTKILNCSNTTLFTFFFRIVVRFQPHGRHAFKQYSGYCIGQTTTKLYGIRCSRRGGRNICFVTVLVPMCS